VGDHGGIIECESQPRRTAFRVLFPIYAGDMAAEDAELPAQKTEKNSKTDRQPRPSLNADSGSAFKTP
jgi:hypothetical protein